MAERPDAGQEHRVPWTYPVATGIVVGVAVGFAAFKVRVSPLAQSLTAVLVAMVLSAGLTVFLWVRYRAAFGGAGGAFFGFGVENLLYLAALLALAAVLHAVLGVVGVALPWVAQHRAPVLGCAGGVYSAVSVANALNSLSIGA